jgi:hypothetical protein
MSRRIAEAASRHNVATSVGSTIASRVQVLGRALQEAGLTFRNAVATNEFARIRFPDWRVAIEAPKRLTYEGVVAMRR